MIKPNEKFKFFYKLALALQENEPFTVGEPDIDGRFERVDDYLFLSLGFASKKNAWAGPDHWKYRKVKGKLQEDRAC